MAKFSMSDLLNSKSKEAVKAPFENFEIKQIPIEKIIPSEKNKYGIRDIEDLAANIEMVGLMHNIVVCKKSDSDMYEIISGERRYRAISKLYEEGKTEWKTIPCKIEINKDALITELELLFANSTARELTDYERTYQAGRIKEILTELKKNGYKFQGRMRDIVAEILKVSSSQMGRMESINEKLSPELIGAFKEDKINITAAYELSRLPEKKQEEALKEIENKGEISVKEVKELRGQPDKTQKLMEKIKRKVNQSEPKTEIAAETKQVDRTETIKLLKEIITDIECGNDGTSFDIKKACTAAVVLIEDEKCN